MPSSRFPDFFIIGAQRCGTTSLRIYLSLHPDVYMPPGETGFFSYQYSKGLGWYLSLFHDKLAIGEKSADYLSSPHAPGRISKHVPDARFIVLLRNPVDRAWSHYQWAVGMGKEQKHFMHALQSQVAAKDGQHSGYLQRGHYASQLKRWFTFFPRDRFLIIESETLFSDSDNTCDQALKFLQLRGCCAMRLKKLGKHGAAKKTSRQMSPVARRWLQDYYRPHNTQLEALLGRQFSWSSIS